MKQGKIKIEEIIVVEGRDDTAAIKRAVTAQTIETHGFGMNEEMWKRIDRAYKSCGVVLFTDPDRAGENIRKGAIFMGTYTPEPVGDYSALSFPLYTGVIVFSGARQ